MKNSFRIITIFLALAFSPLSLNAESVSTADAQKVARNFLMNAGGTKAGASDVKLVWDGRDGTTKTSPFYVFNNGDAFVIVAGDNRMKPVLGYSTSGKFNVSDIPDGLRDLLDSYRNSVVLLDKDNISANTGVSVEWKRALTAAGDASTVVNLNTALWGQNAPYYYNCPMYNGSYCVTGCGATALAIFMRYYKHPKQAYGTIPGYTTDELGIVLPTKTIDYEYQWDKMPLTYSSPYVEEEKNAVATLMADIGQMIQAEYTPSSTWAYTSMILPAMLEHMKYSKNAQCRNRVNYSTADWIALLKTELDAGHPVLYRGDSPQYGGHFYIVDGYDSEDRMHFNWGWEGYDNGFFYFADTDYSTDENAITGLVPDEDWTAPASSSTIVFFDNNSSCFGLSTNTACPTEGTEFTVYASIQNQGTAAFTGRIKLRLRHADKTEQDLGTSGHYNLGPYYYTTKKFYITLPTISAGDELVLYYENDGNWVPVDDFSRTVPLRYNLPDVLSLTYETGTYNVLSIRGMTGMTISYPGSSSKTFSKPVMQIVNPTTGDYTISNGIESYTVSLTF